MIVPIPPHIVRFHTFVVPLANDSGLRNLLIISVYSLNRVKAGLGNIDRQDKQDEKLLHRKLTSSMIGSAFEAIQNLHYFRNVGATSCPSWISFFP